VGLFPTEEPSVYVTAMWRFHVMLYPPATPRPCIKFLPKRKRNILRFWDIRLSMLHILNCGLQIFLCCQQKEHFDLCFQFRVSLLVCSLRCVFVPWSC